jgi:hypothetical protein
LGPPALLLGVNTGLRYATWQGPVVFSRADVAFLLSAPIPRTRLVRGALARGCAAGMLLGAALGLSVFVVLGSRLDAEGLPLLAACVGSLGALGLLVASLAWHVERSAALSRAVLRRGWI